MKIAHRWGNASGGFGTMRALAADYFGSKDVGPIYGLLPIIVQPATTRSLQSRDWPGQPRR
jgi:hypothetical protein